MVNSRQEDEDPNDEDRNCSVCVLKGGRCFFFLICADPVKNKQKLGGIEETYCNSKVPSEEKSTDDD